MEKIDSREVYGDDDVRIDCDCNADKACNECIDGGLYEGGQLPPPPPFIIDPSPLTEEEARAMHALVHCEDEWDCRFCNPEPPVCDGIGCDCNDNVRVGPF